MMLIRAFRSAYLYAYIYTSLRCKLVRILFKVKDGFESDFVDNVSTWYDIMIIRYEIESYWFAIEMEFQFTQ